MYLIAVVVQIVLESLPISSSGHAHMLGLQMPDYLDRLALGPTIIMLALYFYKEIIAVVYDLKNQWRWVFQWGLLIGMATSVTVFLYEFIDQILGQILKTQAIAFPLWVGFASTAILLLSLAWCPYNDTETHKNNAGDAKAQFFKLLLIGVAQGCARLPGVSRLGTTYTVACWLGFSPYRAFRISCALQVPLFTAGFLEGCVKFFKLWRMGEIEVLFTFSTLLIIAGATVGAYALLWVIEALMIRRKLWYVGWYMLVVTALSFFINYLEFFRFILVR